MDIATLTGWGNKQDSLDNLILEGAKLHHIPYVNYANIDAFFDSIRAGTPAHDILIGWSLGGQLACRLVAEGILKPKLLVLVAPAFQYVNDKHIKCGTPRMAFMGFQAGYKMMPGNTLREFGVICCQHDSHARDIVESMDPDDSHQPAWLYWLDELGRFTCRDIDFSNFPRTLILHGKNDVVTPTEQSQLFYKEISNCRLELFDDCGHAPHFHDEEGVKALIKEEWEAL